MTPRLLPLITAFFITHASFSAPLPYQNQLDAHPPWKGGEGLGTLSFKTSAKSPEAQRWFDTGMKLIGNYEFPGGRYAFLRAQELEPEFALAYWGEALSYYRFVWFSTNPKKANAIFAKMDEHIDPEALSKKEKRLIHALRATAERTTPLLAPYHPKSNTWFFRNQMQAIVDDYPEDLEVKIILAHAILGTRYGIFDTDANAEAGKHLQAVLKENPDHPAALHFTLHAFENAYQAGDAKAAAEHYLEVAPAAIHALHMPTHYYYVVGDWDKVIALNQRAWKDSIQRSKDLGISNDRYQYHGYYWIAHAYLQQGKIKEAFEHLHTMYHLMDEQPSPAKLGYISRARAMFLGEVPADNPLWEQLKRRVIPGLDKAPFVAYFGNLFAEAYGAFQLGKQAQFDELLNKFERELPVDQTLWKLNPPAEAAVSIMHKQLQAMSYELQGEQALALRTYRKAVRMDETLPQEHGVPQIIKPSEELLADYLNKLGRSPEAKVYYKKTLMRYPGRRYSLERL